jgi:alpha,alpha-trehalase
MFPWQSGSNGREESQKLHLNPDSGRWIPDNSHRQRHIGAAIAYNVWHYYQVTDDHDFLYFFGAELVLEIARFWASIAAYDEDSDRYDIRGVMGPDEYHTAYPGTDPDDEGGLDNNAYTNVMAAWVLNRARDVLDRLPEDRCRRLLADLALSREEVESWLDIARKLRLCFHGDRILSQFEGYEKLEEFDWEAYAEKYGDIKRLDRILEAEGDSPNKYKASKQADVLMLFYLFSTDELQQLFEEMGYAWDRDMAPRNIDYYLERTSHGSTLSWVTHSWVMARSRRHASWELFCSALDSDIADVQGGTTPEGIHIGAMAGTVDLVHRGYTGIESRGNVLHFNPCLPRELERIELQIRYRRQLLDVEVTQTTLTIESRPFAASPITIAYRGHYRDLSAGERCRFRLLTPAEKNRESDRRKGRAPALPKRERKPGRSPDR